MASERKKYQCCLKKCIQGQLHGVMARVEVKTFEVAQSDRRHMEVAWMDDGEAVFHDVCWKAVLHSLKMDNPFTLCPMEKEMVGEAKKTAEYFDSLDKVRLEAARIARMLKNAHYAIAFTGAGISTSAGIGDFRGRAGQWTERDRENRHGASKHKRSRDFVYEIMRPSYTHEALCKLVDLGCLKHIISQNTDGLHRLAGAARDKVSDLHGNSYIEKCEKCGARYERPFAVRRVHGSQVKPKICVHCHFDHRTGRVCERKGTCDGYLMNTIINFGDSLEKKVLSTAEEYAKRNDTMLCLGSSLRVTPACDLVEMGVDPLRLLICNRQPTPFDKLCYLADKDKNQLGSRVFGDCDVLMREVMTYMVPPEELEEWEGARETRLAEYDAQREIPDV